MRKFQRIFVTLSLFVFVFFYFLFFTVIEIYLREFLLKKILYVSGNRTFLKKYVNSQNLIDFQQKKQDGKYSGKNSFNSIETENGNFYYIDIINVENFNRLKLYKFGNFDNQIFVKKSEKLLIDFSNIGVTDDFSNIYVKYDKFYIKNGKLEHKNDRFLCYTKNNKKEMNIDLVKYSLDLFNTNYTLEIKSLKKIIFDRNINFVKKYLKDINIDLYDYNQFLFNIEDIVKKSIYWDEKYKKKIVVIDENIKERVREYFDLEEIFISNIEVEKYYYYLNNILLQFCNLDNCKIKYFPEINAFKVGNVIVPVDSNYRININPHMIGNVIVFTYFENLIFFVTVFIGFLFFLFLFSRWAHIYSFFLLLIYIIMVLYGIIFFYLINLLLAFIGFLSYFVVKFNYKD